MLSHKTKEGMLRRCTSPAATSAASHSPCILKLSQSALAPDWSGAVQPLPESKSQLSGGCAT